jgi:transcriptional regulator with XRE-family HTH domain
MGMNFGDKLRQPRQAKNLSQPELSDSLGIEQSYLSKLENGKSLPSSDVFNRILDAFALSVGDLIDELDHGSRLQLRQIPDVANHFDRQKQLIIGNRRRWLLISAALLAVGVALIYGGTAQLFVPGVVYQYKSHGIVLEGEPKEVFAIVARLSPFAEEKVLLDERLDESFLKTRYFRGNVFNMPVGGGSRTYYLEGENEIDSWVNKAVASLGLIMVVLGTTGFMLEKKLAHYQ